MYINTSSKDVHFISLDKYVKTVSSNKFDNRVFSHDYKHIYLTSYGVTIKTPYPNISDTIDITIIIDISNL